MDRSGYEYDTLVHAALTGVVRKVLRDVAHDGLIGGHHFYITFNTRHPDVVLPDYIEAQYPEEMPLILQHQFWGLDVEDDAFEVTLSFKGVQERLRVPFDAITTFADPSVNFALRLGMVEKADTDPDATAPAQSDAPETAESKAAGDNVVSIDRFRKG